MHPLFRFPVSIHLNTDGPVGPDAHRATLYFGDRRFAQVDVNAPALIEWVSD